MTTEPVTTKPKRRRKPREHRVDVLSAWLTWAADRDSTPDALNRQLQALVMSATGAGAQTYIDPAGEQLRWLQCEVVRAFTFHATADKGAELELSEAPGTPPRYTISKGHGIRPCYHGGAAQVGMVGLRAVLAHPELGRVTRCIVPGCPAPLVGRKGGRYCAEHGSGKSRSRRHLEKLTPVQRRQNRRRLYVASLKEHQPTRYWELLAQCQAVARALRSLKPGEHGKRKQAEDAAEGKE
jgi:hypothetical protein